MITCKAVWTSDDLTDYPRRVKLQLRAVIRKTAFDVQAEAQSLVPVDTGAAKNSIYVLTTSADGYAEAVGDATQAFKARYPQQDLDLFPQVEHLEDDNQLTAYVIVAVMYALFLEEGTSLRPARPFLEPAVMHNESSFTQAVAEVMNQAISASAGGTP